ncbi:hypothetical protein V0U79_00100 [Hyphobacterium sp. HN65]|uniref:Uncharacterized protein n=1 Tax=Hyphobacterium lacteum TaxID=3116575 RepID=A0ABU7LLF1_9PROT|nr:hypothetical protein [Hyphobacterium sp. HN65]MEE2524751.1 hypothetical protein [Hyphobacterium sp. HN65]
MTMNDPFEDRLRAAFAAAQPADDDAEDFVKKVQGRLARPDRRRALVLGGAGSTGSAVAGTQLEGFFSNPDLLPTDGIMGQVFTYTSPEMLAAGVLALMIAGFAVVVPKNLYAG